MELNINGKNINTDADPNMPLLWLLRDELNMTGTKFGCGVAACGACTVHLDGQAVRSCVTPLASLAGKQILTIESLGTTDKPHARLRVGDVITLPLRGEVRVIEVRALAERRGSASAAQSLYQEIPAVEHMAVSFIPCGNNEISS